MCSRVQGQDLRQCDEGRIHMKQCNEGRMYWRVVITGCIS
jgi:hypothetical protein